MSSLELAYAITEKSVENAYRTMQYAKRDGQETYARQGFRAARARDPRLLLALQKGTEVLQSMSVRQFGARGQDVGGIAVEATEFQLWRNAHASADSGQPDHAYDWIYAMAGLLAGVISL